MPQFIKRHPVVILLVLTVFVLLTPNRDRAADFTQSVHGDPTKLLRECGSCHVGHGRSKSPMLPADISEVCFRCHGSPAEVSNAKDEKILSRSVEMRDIQNEFNKPYRHPIEETGVHTPDEDLPETNPSIPRHSECVDCHEAHGSLPQRMNTPLPGKGVKVFTYKDLNYEFELCYRCHSESANLPVQEKNKRQEFSTRNPSYHPVEGPGRSSDIPSLLSPYDVRSIISCTDCHSNDDPGGPRGPHGSIYEHLLNKNYYLEDGHPESEFAYALCYQCHLRGSILGNESFSRHREHIETNKTSCYTCHDSHGSQSYTRLIRFNKDPRYTQVYPNREVRLEYINIVGSSPECYLSCHNVDHNPTPVQSPGFIQKQNFIPRPIFAPERGGKW